LQQDTHGHSFTMFKSFLIVKGGQHAFSCRVYACVQSVMNITMTNFQLAAGSPSDVDPFITGLAVPDVQAVSALKLQINPPDVSASQLGYVHVSAGASIPLTARQSH